MKLLRAENERPMFDNLTLRNTFLAVAAVPASVLVLVAFWATAIDRPILAVWAGLGAVATMAVGHIAGQRVDERLAVLDQTIDRLTNDELPAIIAAIMLTASLSVTAMR